MVNYHDNVDVYKRMAEVMVNTVSGVISARSKLSVCLSEYSDIIECDEAHERNRVMDWIGMDVDNSVSLRDCLRAAMHVDEIVSPLLEVIPCIIRAIESRNQQITAFEQSLNECKRQIKITEDDMVRLQRQHTELTVSDRKVMTHEIRRVKNESQSLISKMQVELDIMKHENQAQNSMTRAKAFSYMKDLIPSSHSNNTSAISPVQTDCSCSDAILDMSKLLSSVDLTATCPKCANTQTELSDLRSRFQAVKEDRDMLAEEARKSKMNIDKQLEVTGDGNQLTPGEKRLEETARQFARRIQLMKDSHREELRRLTQIEFDKVSQVRKALARFLLQVSTAQPRCEYCRICLYTPDALKGMSGSLECSCGYIEKESCAVAMSIRSILDVQIESRGIGTTLRAEIGSDTQFIAERLSILEIFVEKAIKNKLNLTENGENEEKKNLSSYKKHANIKWTPINEDLKNGPRMIHLGPKTTDDWVSGGLNEVGIPPPLGRSVRNISSRLYVEEDRRRPLTSLRAASLLHK